jgi:diguanylate cyclase (GGDEF)-like protein
MVVLTAGLASLTLARSLWVGIAGTGTLYSGWPAQLYYGYAAMATLLLVPCLQWMVFIRLNRQLAETAHRDTLTGLLNRSGLADAVARHWGTRPPRTLTLMHVDVDCFKSVNDDHGHALGDEVLQALGKGLAGGMRGGDIVARTGGEEFLVVCIELHPLAARAMAERLREIAAQVAVPVPSTHRNLSCTVSIGVSRPCDEAAGFAAAWREADQALYAAKTAGRDRVRMFSTLTEVQVELPQRMAAVSKPVPLEQDTTPDGLQAQLDDGPSAQRAAD